MGSQSFYVPPAPFFLAFIHLSAQTGVLNKSDTQHFMHFESHIPCSAVDPGNILMYLAWLVPQRAWGVEDELGMKCFGSWLNLSHFGRVQFAAAGSVSVKIQNLFATAQGTFCLWKTSMSGFQTTLSLWIEGFFFSMQGILLWRHRIVFKYIIFNHHFEIVQYKHSCPMCCFGSWSLDRSHDLWEKNAHHGQGIRIFELPLDPIYLSRTDRFCPFSITSQITTFFFVPHNVKQSMRSMPVPVCATLFICTFL